MTEQEVISRTFERIKTDSAFRAALKKADSISTEYQSWEYLASFGVDIEHENKRRPYTVVLSAVAKSESKSNGSMQIGRAILSAYGDDSESQPAKTKLRRLLACDDSTELFTVIQPILQFVGSKEVPLDYAALLKDLKLFDLYSDSIKAKWAQSFYGTLKTETEESE